MLIIKKTPESNGAYDNQYIEGNLDIIPEGWAVVDEAIVDDTMAMLPWIEPTFDGDSVAAVAKGKEPIPVIPWEVVPPLPTFEELVETVKRLELGLTEIRTEVSQVLSAQATESIISEKDTKSN